MIRPAATGDPKVALAEKRPRVLLAEDDDEMRTLLKAYLELAGFVVKGVADGRAVMRAVREEAWAPDVLVTDVHMPLMSGLEVLREFGASADGVPTIVITSFGDTATHTKARQLGAARVLDKPFDSSKLVAAVRALLPKV
jgi:two-component system phosphate regulon response regulator PhoB